MTQTPIRYKKLIEALPKHKFAVRPAAKEAGFAESTAIKQPKRLLRSALNYQARELAEHARNNKEMTSPEMKKTMAEIVGLSSDEVMNALKYIATQQKDLNSALKVLAPLAKQMDVILTEQEKSDINIPILNVTVKEKTLNTAQLGHIAPTMSPNTDYATYKQGENQAGQGGGDATSDPAPVI